MQIPRELRSILLAAAATAVAGNLTFGIAHAIFISPIWSSLPGGLPFAALTGLTMGWAAYELRRAGRLRWSWLQGAVFGVGLWLTLFPTTALAFWLRHSGLRAALGDWEAILEAILGFSTGGVVGWVLTRRRLGLASCGAATLGLLLAMGGPVAVGEARRNALLFLSFAGICALAGSILLATLSRLATRSVADTSREPVVLS